MPDGKGVDLHVSMPGGIMNGATDKTQMATAEMQTFFIRYFG